MKLLKKIMSIIACTAAIAASVGSCITASAIDIANPVRTERYTGNQGDSFINILGTRNGFTTVDGITYVDGMEMWVARWNYRDEISWVFAEYDVDDSMKEFSGTLSVLDESYNTDDYVTTLKIFADGTEVYSFRMTPGFEPQKINIPLEGVKKLKISVNDKKAVSGGTSFCIVNGILGDVDQNGTVDALDASAVLTAYSNTATGKPIGLSELQCKCAEINNDGAIDALDASLILSYYAYKATGGENSFEKFLDN